MKELSIEHLSKSYGTKSLLEDINYAIRTGDRIGLIGPNGTGKSSLLKVLAGKDSYDEGEIKTPNEYSIAYLDQNPVFDLDKSVIETIYDSQAPLVQLVLQYQQLQSALVAQPEDRQIQAEFNRITEAMTVQGGWDVEVRAKSILTQLGLKDFDRPVAACSGGERKRVGIAQVLIAEPDLLILDEPTNHLDIDSIQWLEQYLANYKGALLLVTHDRYFLDRVVNQIIELRHGQLTEYQGNYQDYVAQRAELADLQARQQHKQDQLFKQELAWMRTGARARTTKQQARIDRFEALKDDISQRHGQEGALDFAFDQQRIGNQVINIDDLVVKIGDLTVIDGLTRHFVKGDRIGIIGDNGVGKSTLLNAIAGLHPVSAGSVVIGQTVRLAYYRQLDQDLPSEERILTYLTKIADNFKCEDCSTVSAAQLLEQFNFPRNIHGSQIKTLSGGEKRRLYLLSLLVQEPNVLFLDEPTNDLDIDTLNVLEDYLHHFQGTVFIVSHDRYFLDKTVDQLLELQGQGDYEWFWGNYTEYLDQRQQRPVSTSPATPAPSVNKTQTTEKKKRPNYHERKEWETIEEDIMSQEALIESIEANMLAHPNDAVKLMDWQRELVAANQHLEQLYERYDYLSDLVDA